MRLVCVILAVVLCAVSVSAAIIAPEVERKAVADDATRVVVVLNAGHAQSVSGVEQRVLDSLDLSNETSEYDFAVSHQYATVAALAGNVTSEGLEKLRRNPLVKGVYPDYEVKMSLSDSVPLMHGPDAWNVSVGGVFVNGSNQSVCIIDTGVDYTHASLGGCTPTILLLDGINESLVPVVESAHPYSNNENLTFKINKPGFSTIAVHFKNISLETPGAADSIDRVLVLDGLNRTVAVYKGVMTDVWSPVVSGDTLYVRLVSDPSVIDFGFLIDQVRNGTTNTTYNWSNCSKMIDGWDFVNSDADPMDDQGHGTHVAGIVVSQSTFLGVAPNSRFVAIKALNSAGGGFMSDVVGGIDWCVANKEKDSVGVITMSLGTSCTSSPETCGGATYCDAADSLTSAAITNAANQGILVTVASGNDGTANAVASPGCMSGATSVGATTKADGIASFSNSAPILDVLAPGQSICSTRLGSAGGSCGSGTFTILSGTSMSTPHVAGVALLVREYLSLVQGIVPLPALIKNRLKTSGKRILDSRNGIVFSRVDARDALNPVVSFLSSTTTNNSLTNGSFAVNVSADVNLSRALLELTLPNGSVLFTNLTKENGTVFSTAISGLFSGAHVYRVLGNDSVLVGTSSSRSVVIDATPPLVSMLFPVNNSVVSSQLVNISWSVLDDVDSALNCTLLTDGTTNASSLAAGNNSVTNKSVIFSGGNHSVETVCVDDVGHSARAGILFGVQAAPSIFVTKTVLANAVVRGGLVQYVINVTNQGVEPALNLTLVESYPQGVFLQSSSIVPVVGNATFSLGNLSSGQSFLLNLSLAVSSAIANSTALLNSVNVSFTSVVGVSNSSVANVSVVVHGIPVVHTTVQAPSSVVSQSLLTYAVLLNNSGDDTASSLFLTENYPQGVAFVSAIPSPTLGNNSWNLGSLAPGIGSINITVNLTGAVTNSSVLNNSVNISYTTFAGGVFTNASSQLVTVRALPNLTLTKTASASSISPGAQINYSITLTNTGGETAFNITLTENYALSTTFNNASPAPTSGSTIWNITSLAPGTSTTINISVNTSSTSSGTANNTVTVSYQAIDASTRTSSASALTTITASSGSGGSSSGSSGGSGSGGGGGGGGGSSSSASISAPVAAVAVPVIPVLPVLPQTIPVESVSSAKPVAVPTPVAPQQVSQKTNSLVTGAAVSLPDLALKKNASGQHTVSWYQRTAASSITFLLALSLAFVLFHWRKN